jgi:hypothetical protein
MASTRFHDNDHNNNDDDTQNTSSSQPVSDLSDLTQEQTDTLGRAILQHARDRQRLLDATAPVNNNNIPAFSKSRAKPRIALTMENLARNDASHGQSRPGSHENSDVQADATATAGVALRSISERHVRRQGSIDASERSSPSHNVPSQWGRKGRSTNFLRRISQAGSPVKADKEKEEESFVDPDRIYRRRTMFTGDLHESDQDEEGQNEEKNDSIEMILDRERQNMRDSSPTGKISTRRALSGHSFSKEEVADLAGRGLTTSRLSAFGPSIARRRTLSKTPTLEPFGSDDGEENDQAGNLIVTKNIKPSSIPRREVQQLTNGKSAGARDLLKQLASASGSSTSPTDVHREKLPATRDTFASLNRRLNGQPELSPRRSTFKRDTIQSAAGLRTQSRADSGTAPAAGEDEVDEMDADEGANEPARRALSTHSLPHSAAEELLQNPDAHALGDSTIHSLQDLLDANPDVDFSEVLPLDGDTLALAAQVVTPLQRAASVEVDIPLQQIPSERQEEIIALERMNDRLRAARTGLRDASRGLGRVGNQVEDTALESRGSARRVVHLAKKGDETHRHVCEQCGRGNEDITLSKLVWRAWLSWIHNFYTWPKGRRPRLTWLGLACVLFWVWWWSETILW